MFQYLLWLMCFLVPLLVARKTVTTSKLLVAVFLNGFIALIIHGMMWMFTGGTAVASPAVVPELTSTWDYIQYWIVGFIALLTAKLPEWYTELKVE